MMKKLLKRLNLSPIELKDVFTPATAATLTYVERIDLDIQISKALDIPGMQLVLHGHSGSGKTTILQNILRKRKMDFIVTNCTLDSTANQLILDAFDKLNPFYKSEKTTSRTIKAGFELKTEYQALELILKSELGHEATEKLTRGLPMQLTPQRLAEFLGYANVVWIVEDFHKISAEESHKLSQILKVFVDTAFKYKNTKLITVGAVGTAREMINYGSELTNRISEIFIPLMTRYELESIIQKGEKLLSISFSEKARKDIIAFSNSLAAICHHLCYSICFNSGVQITQRTKRQFGESHMKGAVLDYLKQNSDSFKKTLDRALKSRDGRFDNTKNILLAFCKSEKDELTKKEILSFGPNKHFYSTTIKEYLELLTTPEYGEILRFDNNSGKFSFFNPFIKAYALMHFATEDTDSQKVKVKIHLDERFEEIMRYILSSRLDMVRGHFTSENEDSND